jgi:hypothetical protein
MESGYWYVWRKNNMKECSITCTYLQQTNLVNASIFEVLNTLDRLLVFGFLN